MAITVPKPITNPSPVTVTHTPYDPTGMLFPKSSTISPGPAKPIGTITGVYPNISSLTNATAPKQTAPKSTMYKAPNPYLVNQMLERLMTGGSVDPTTGWYGSAAQAAGKAGGSSLSGFLAHKGVLDPASAQYAVDQFKQQIASGQLVPGGGYGQWRPVQAPPPVSPPATNAAGVPIPSQQAQFNPETFALQDSINRAVEAMKSGQQISNQDLGILTKFKDNPQGQAYLNRALGVATPDPSAVQLTAANLTTPEQKAKEAAAVIPQSATAQSKAQTPEQLQQLKAYQSAMNAFNYARSQGLPATKPTKPSWM